APIQVVIVPIWRNDAERAAVEPLIARVQTELAGAGVRVHTDWRDQVRPGFKFNDWELKGVPLRFEVGPRDAAADQVVAVRRDTRDKAPIESASVPERTMALLEDIQTSLFAQARHFLDSHTSMADSWEEV